MKHESDDPRSPSAPPVSRAVENDEPTRRSLLLATARIVGVAALSAGAALLLLRNGRAACRERTACGSCRRRDRCEDAFVAHPHDQTPR